MSTDQQQWDIVTGVGLTALAVAAGRAAESVRTDALISDPYASPLVVAAQPPEGFPFANGNPTMEGADEELWRHMSDYVGVRSRAFDDFFQRAYGDGVTQAVILASGLDTRAYRLDWPAGAVVYELDQPAVLDFKLGALKNEGAAPTCDHRPVEIDLRDDWGAALEEAGFDSSRPTAWLAEGLLPYLPPEAETRLFEEITRLSASGSRFAVERIDNIDHIMSDPWMRERAQEMNMDFENLFPEGERQPVEPRLNALGWQLENHSVTESAASYGRTLQDGSELFVEHVTHSYGQLA